jgi:hypothetical protein
MRLTILKQERTLSVRLEKKRIIKEDGRLLTFYHFPATATDSQTAAFGAVEESTPQPVESTAKSEGGDHV